MADLDVEKRIRRLRKKLIQIEKLEILNRDLNDEELAKVCRKTDLRRELLSHVKDIEMKRSADKSTKSTVNKPKAPRLNGPAEPPDDTSLVDPSPLTTESTSPTETNLPKPQLPVASGTSCSIPTGFSSTPFIPAKPNSQSGSGERPSYSSTECQTITINQKPDVRKTDTGQDQTDSVPRSSTGKLSSTRLGRAGTSTAPPTASTTAGVECVRAWRRRQWAAEQLEGHEDLIVDCDISIEHNLAVTASRDTTIKVWDLNTGSMLHSLRGHRGPVTGAKLLVWRADFSSPSTVDLHPEEAAPPLSASNASIGGDHQPIEHQQLVCVSTGTDCIIKVWNVGTGLSCSEIYTYNGINKLQVYKNNQCSITGTDGGKLEMYSLNSGSRISSLSAHEDSIMALSLYEEENAETALLASGSSDGIIKVFQVTKTGFKCLYVSENLCTLSTETSIHTRPVYSIHIAASGVVYYGDNGHNLKMLEWRANRLSKFSNHMSDQGFTDHLTAIDNILVATSFDIDSGFGQLNLYRQRDGQIPQYLATLADDQTNRIYVLASREKDGNVVILTGGRHLKIWRSVSNSNLASGKRDVSTNVQGCVLTLGDNPVIDSGSETDADTDHDDTIDAPPSTNTSSPPMARPSKPNSGYCNCQVM